MEWSIELGSIVLSIVSAVLLGFGLWIIKKIREL